MNSRIHDFSPFAALAACSLTLCACQSNTHTMTDAATGKTVVCQECYDAVTAAHRDHPASATSRIQTLRTYQCPCCKTEMSVYIQNGTHMVKCGGCAKEGAAWDKCAPPDSAAK
ncbi:MAG TPA: hypothetical protein PKE29_02965 [Phycisphaerales bacterium]|nr:hypothetical protein [Phycisphaerales bacterium]